MKREHIVKQIQTTLHQHFPQAQVILYGSEARGDARPDSDIDLMILMPEQKVSKEKKEAVFTMLYQIELDTTIPINALVYSQAYWDNRPTDFFKLNIQKEGIEL